MKKEQKLMRMVLIGGMLTGVVFLAGYAQAEGYGKERREAVKAQRAQQKQENKAFRQTVKEMPKEERKSAIKAHIEQQQQENKAFMGEQHAKDMQALEKKLSKNPNLTDAQKQEAIKAAEDLHQQVLSHYEEEIAQGSAEYDKVVNDPALTPEQKKEALKKYSQEQRKENKEYYQQRKQDAKEQRKAFKESWSQKE